MGLSKANQLLVAQFDKLTSERADYDNLWQHVADYILPRKSDINQEKATGVEDYVNNIFDMTASQANLTLAAGIVTNSTPATERWFAFQPPESILEDKARGGKARDWFEQCTKIAHRELQRSNFYTEVHEAHLDRNAMGTCALGTFEGKKTLLNFRSLRIGTYVILTDDEGNVDGVMRLLKLNARQAAASFGEENLGPKFRKDLESGGDCSEKHDVIHVVIPRADADRLPGRMDGENKPIASIYIDKTDDVELENTGFDEMPIAVSRFLKWRDREWGWGPGIQCLPIVRQVNFLEQKQDMLAEIMVEPRVLMPSNLIDEVDFQAGGITAFDENDPARPEEWLSGGKYEVGEDRISKKQAFIERAFHNELFQMFANLERQITATETMARLEEKLDNFSPTFHRWTTEGLSPTLTRTFAILFRAGAFPDPPAEAYIPTAQGLALPMPEVVYNSKIALALKAKENGSLRDTLASLEGVIMVAPDVIDNFDTDQIVRDVSRNNALPPRWLRDLEAVAARREQRAQAQAAQEQAALLEQGSKAAANLGKAPRQIQEQLV